MLTALLKDSNVHSELERVTEQNLLTRVLISALCPFLKSEIAFGESTTGHSETFKFWVQQDLTGDMEGRVGIGCDHHTLLSLALRLKVRTREGKADQSGVLLTLHDLICDSFRKHFAQEDFQCDFSKKPEVIKDFQYVPTAAPHILTSVETKFGILKVLLALSEDSSRLLEEECDPEPQSKLRKIRVYAHQLDRVFSHAVTLEQLEGKLLTQPHARLQIRSEIRRLKRIIRHLKSEPLDTLFSPARRLAVEIAKQEGKQVKLSTHGTGLYMDKSLLNYLYEPILHIIRNAVDHGIETPEERERVGKPACGFIKCIISFTANGIRIIISDDGRGLDLGKIRERAIAKGFLDPALAETKAVTDIYPLIFEPGFSTRESANAVSGRGLGLDIVKKGVQSLEGIIRILSTSHRGTSFEIMIPINEDLTSVRAVPSGMVDSDEEEEKAVLLDELGSYFEKLFRVTALLNTERGELANYEAYRLVHSIKGVVAFLGWNRVAIFCHRLEELLKSISEKKLTLTAEVRNTLVEAVNRASEFCEASQAGVTYSLFEIRRIEGHIERWMWSTDQMESNNVQLDKLHLRVVQGMFELPNAKRVITIKREADFKLALKQPFGALVQFSGDRSGYAGILLPEDTLMQITQPLLSGRETNHSLETHFWALTEFSCLMGSQLSALSQKEGVWLQSASPLTYYGQGQPLRILGFPTYCYACEWNGKPFFLVGDFPQRREGVQKAHQAEGSYHPSLILQEAQRQCVKYFSNWNLSINFSEIPSQSDLVGFDNGVTAIISCMGSPSSILFMSYDRQLAQYIYQSFTGKELAAESADFYDCINETSNIVGGLLVSELEKRRINLSLTLPTVFVGKAYVANFNRLYVTNRLLANTPRGRFELQVLVTYIPE